MAASTFLGLTPAFVVAEPHLDPDLRLAAEAPQHRSGVTHGRSEEKLKCAGITVLGCAAGNPLVCFGSAVVSGLCAYLVDKTCEENPDSCQPGWTEG